MTSILYSPATIVIGLFKKISDYLKINLLIFKTPISSFIKIDLAAPGFSETHRESMDAGTSFASSNIVGQDLIASLRGQYFQALYNPQMRSAFDWNPYVGPPPTSPAPSPNKPRRHEWRVRDSIEGLLSNPGSIDAEFALVSIDNLPDALPRAAPEILQVFAPTKPVEAREPVQRLSELVLREHHAASLDSPLRCFPEAVTPSLDVPAEEN